MGAGLELATRAHDDSLGDVIAALYVWEGSSSDPLESRSFPSETVRARDLLSALPVLWWHMSSDSEDEMQRRVNGATALVQASCLGAVEFDPTQQLPVAPELLEGTSFVVAGGELTVTSAGRPLGLFGEISIGLDPRLEWFLELCDTLSLVVEADDKAWVATIKRDGGPPLQAFHNGSLASKEFPAIVERSQNWKAGTLGNPSIVPGMDACPDHHVRTYSATQHERDLPDLVTYIGKCLACAGSGRSREHCVPSWIARDQGVVPVVAEVFCKQCNSFFGKDLEAPISQAMKSGRLDQDLSTDLFLRWAIKTALTISAASDVQFESSWMAELRRGSVPGDFQVFARINVQMEPGYIYTVTHFSRAARKQGYFLFSFATDGLVFVVLRNPSELIHIPGVQRVYPYEKSDEINGTLDIAKLHDWLVEVMTGHKIHRSD